MNITHLASNGMGIFNYRPRREGRMAVMNIWYSSGEGIQIILQIQDVEVTSAGTTFYSDKHGDPRVSIIVPMARYSKKQFTEALEKIDSHVPELVTAYEADQTEGERKLKELCAELFK